MTIAKTGFFPVFGSRTKLKPGSTYAVCLQKNKRGAPPVWDCKNSINGEENIHEVVYNSDYAGAFITDWEIPIEPQGSGEDSGMDFIVDWTN